MTVGLDLSDRYTQVCVMDVAGRVVEESRVRTGPEAIRERFAGHSRMRIALEAGAHSPWVSRLLESQGQTAGGCP